jgi:plastocyanin
MSPLHTPFFSSLLPPLRLKKELVDYAPGLPIFNGALHSGYTYTSTPLKMPGVRSTWLPALCLATLTCVASGQDVKGATGAINSTTFSVEEGEITVHTIEVSNETHYFTPNSINALPGDIVTFKFWPGNHSVIRAEYAYPCIPYEDVDENGEGGFYSGVMSPDSQDVSDDNVRDSIAYSMRAETNKR